MTSDRIEILFHRSIDKLEIDITPGLKCEDVIRRCILYIAPLVCEPGSDALKNLSMYLPVFGLRQLKSSSQGNQIWLPIWHEFSAQETRVYKFRVRHRPLGGYNPDSVMGEYLFLQMLDDFLLDPSFRLDKTDEARILLLLTMAVLIPKDLPLRNSEIVDENFKTDKLGWDFFLNYTKYLSKTVIRALKLQKYVRRFWVNHSIVKTIKEWKTESHRLRHFKEEFYEHLVKAAPLYCFEFYQIVPDGYITPVSAMLRLDCSSNENGLYYGEELKPDCVISAIEEMKFNKPQNFLAETWTVLVVVSDGPPERLPFKSQEEAESFLSMAQSLVKLCVRWDFYLNHDFLTPGEKMDFRLKSFGPLFDDTAKSYLHDLSRKPAFDGKGFLIHLSTSKFDTYIVVSCTQTKDDGQQQQSSGDDGEDLEFEWHQIICNPEGYMLLSKVQQDLDEVEDDQQAEEFWRQDILHSSLLSLFVLQAQPKDYSKRADINEEYKVDIDPEDTSSSLPMPSRPLVPDTDENLTSLFLPKDLRNSTPIEDKNIKMRKFKVFYNTKPMMKVEVASTDEGDAEAFREGLERLENLRRFKTDKFLQLHGLVLMRQLTVVMELADNGDLLTFLCKCPQSPHDKVELMRQVVAVLLYMHTNNYYHGNIRSRKFMVFDDAATCHVKLKMEHPGISSRLDTLPMDDELNLERVAWLSPERQRNLKEITYESECFSVGTTLAEILYRSDNFVESMKLQNNKKLKQFLDENHLKPPENFSCDASAEDNGSTEHTEVKALWQSVWEEVIVPCWRRDPNLRPVPNTLITSFVDIGRRADDISEQMRETVKDVEYGDHGVTYPDHNSDPVSLQQLRAMLEKKRKEFIINIEEKVTLDKKELGKGHFGKVHKGMMQVSSPRNFPPTERPVAVKYFKRIMDNTEEEIRKEIFIAAQLDHKNIVGLLGAGFTRPQNSRFSSLVLITEYMNSGSLYHHLLKCDPSHNATAQSLLNLCLDVVEGMIYLSGKDIVHRDLAPRNVLLHEKDGRLQARVADFGLSRTMDADYRFYRSKTHEAFPWPTWPPECLVDTLSERLFTSQGDVWSFGILLWLTFYQKGNIIKEMSRRLNLDEKFLSDHPEEALRLYQSGWRPPRCEASMSTVLYQVMLDCWHEAPRERPAFVDLEGRIRRLIV